MADEVETVKNVLDVLGKASEVASKFEAVSKILQITSSFTSAFPFVGAVLGLVKGFLEDTKHEEILQCFEKLRSEIKQVRADIKDLEMTIKWEGVKLQYGDVVRRIQKGMKYCLEIGKAKGNDESKKRYQERLKELCSNQEFSLALDQLLDGITGNCIFCSAILDELYDKTKGHRPKISSLASRLLQLVSGGLMVDATYEAMVRGEEGAREVMQLYDERMVEVNAKVQSVLDRCMNDFSEHMLSDLNCILDKGGSNEGLLDELLALMREKYDWQEHVCLVYDDLPGSKNHYFKGYQVNSLHRNGKCGIVFYRNAGEPPRFSDRYDEAFNIVKEGCDNTSRLPVVQNKFEPPIYFNAKWGYDTVERSLAERSIDWTGCVFIRDTANLRFRDNFSTQIIEKVCSNFHAILMLQ